MRFVIVALGSRRRREQVRQREGDAGDGAGEPEAAGRRVRPKEFVARLLSRFLIFAGSLETQRS
jgi:hypothetical protein